MAGLGQRLRAPVRVVVSSIKPSDWSPDVADKGHTGRSMQGHLKWRLITTYARETAKSGNSMNNQATRLSDKGALSREGLAIGARTYVRARFNRIMTLVILTLTVSHLNTPAMAEENQNGGYRINPGDRLQVSVWKEEDLQLDVLVRPDGGFSMPLAGDIRAAGQRVDELQSEISKRLHRYIPDPTVSVAVSEPLGNVVYVIGKVERPGALIATRRIDVLQVLSMAGGMTEFAAVDEIRILRRKEGEQVTIPFKYSEVERGENLEQNVRLESGDVVIVP